MADRLHAKKCAIEFRVAIGKLDEAVRYYEDIFGVKEKERYKGLAILEKVKEDKDSKWFYVAVREKEAGNTIEGPIVYWLERNPGSIVSIYEEILAGREPTAMDEPPVTGVVASNRASVIDPYGNRLGFTNPDYPP